MQKMKNKQRKRISASVQKGMEKFLKKKLIECHACGYQWFSGSKIKLITCPSCMRKTKGD